VTTSHAPLVATQDIAKSYGPVVALRAVDLTVQPGEIHALLGANGAGKSTLVKILTGVIGADRGTVEVQGQEVHLAGPPDARRHGLATVFQDPALIPDLTVDQNLRLTDTDAAEVRRWLGDLGMKDLDLDELVSDLPLPILRVLDLARALAQDPVLLMLDEITAALPSDLAARVFNVAHAWKERGRSVLFISHRLGEVLLHCDQATVLRDGRNVAAFAPSEGGEQRMVEAMLGEAAHTDAGLEQVGAERTKGDVVFEVRDVAAGDRVKGVSLSVRSGEILGIAGLEGQGQEVLFRLLSGDLRPGAGELLVNGKSVSPRSPYDLIRHGVVLVPADRLQALLPQRSVRENLALPLYNRPAQWRPINGPGEQRRVSEAIGRLVIDTRAQRQVRRLSGGNQQKVTIGRWLTAGFRVLLCFDPTRGIDIGTKQQIYELLHELAAEGVAVIVYTSELREIPIVCDRVLVMYDGQVVHEQDAATADESTLLTAAHGLEREGAA
jgi:ribose transport system ATP-binding protein